MYQELKPEEWIKKLGQYIDQDRTLQAYIMEDITQNLLPVDHELIYAEQQLVTHAENVINNANYLQEIKQKAKFYPLKYYIDDGRLGVAYDPEKTDEECQPNGMIR